ncbi:hypothetical protein RRG08_021182, partial [Elysia crispata]
MNSSLIPKVGVTPSFWIWLRTIECASNPTPKATFTVLSRISTEPFRVIASVLDPRHLLGSFHLQTSLSPKQTTERRSTSPTMKSVYFICLMFNLLFLATGVFSDQVTAFSAGLTQPRSLEAHQNVVFDHVYVNTGGGYNSGTGVFTCPTAGLYMFQINALTKIDHSMWLKLYHNNNYICSVWGRTSSEYVPG